MNGKAAKLKELVDLAMEQREPAEAKRILVRAEAILRDLEDLEDRICADQTQVGGMDYSTENTINAAIIRYLESIGRPATPSELTTELVRGQFRGYKDPRKMAIRVGRCIRAYTIGKPSENPKITVHDGLVGLVGWTTGNGATGST